MSATEGFSTCALPNNNPDCILLGHGSGGRLTSELIRHIFLPIFGGDELAKLEDQATLPAPSPGTRLAFTTDSFVVKPIFFRGGDIGRLAVCGTVNDLAVGGAIPKYLSVAFILEEGLAITDLTRIVKSMKLTCDEVGITIVTGDTKVVDRGKGDQIFITTTGIGEVPAGVNLSIHSAKPGDRILISGTIGDHGVAILSEREGLQFETELQSDVAPLHDLAQLIIRECPDVRCMRDPTRGGVSGVLHELSEASKVSVRLDEASLPFRDEVRAACEMLGLDPIYVANEGKLIAVVPATDAERVLTAVRSHPNGRNAAIIGEVRAERRGMVTIRSRIGTERIVPQLTGEQLPRIC